MAMAVIGRAPTAEAGRRFDNNIWWWRGLIAYCHEVAPTVIDRLRGWNRDGPGNWFTNDGDGLDAPDCQELAVMLRAALAAGRTAAYEASHNAAYARLPDELCSCCEGTGLMRLAEDGFGFWPVASVSGQDITGARSCLRCGGKGRSKVTNDLDPFAADNVVEWCAFLETCGGFEIW